MQSMPETIKLMPIQKRLSMVEAWSVTASWSRLPNVTVSVLPVKENLRLVSGE